MGARRGDSQSRAEGCACGVDALDSLRPRASRPPGRLQRPSDSELPSILASLSCYLKGICAKEFRPGSGISVTTLPTPALCRSNSERAYVARSLTQHRGEADTLLPRRRVERGSFVSTRRDGLGALTRAAIAGFSLTSRDRRPPLFRLVRRPTIITDESM